MSFDSVDRRDFLKATGFLGGGLMLGFSWAQGNSKTQASAELVSLTAFIKISPEDGVTLVMPIPEMGQGIRTACSMCLAEELEVDLDSVTVVQSPPDDAMGFQVAAGSSSVRRQFLNLRRAGAGAREMLVGAAAKQWKVNAGDCRAEKGYVLHKKKGKLSYEELAVAASKMRVPSSPKLKDRSEFVYLGKSVKNIDSKEIVTGEVAFGIDAVTDDLHYASLVRSPVHQGKLVSFDGSKAEQFKGVVQVLRVQDTVAVVATNTWAANEGAKLVVAEWKNGSNDKGNTDALKKMMFRRMSEPQEAKFSTGDFKSNFEKAVIKVDTQCYVPTLVHAPMEPPNCTAVVRDGQAEIWASCQMLNKVKEELPGMVGLPMKKIVFHQMRIGGSFGRKLGRDFMEEAVAVAKATKLPIKLTFSRSDDIRHSAYRGATAARARCGLDEKGFPIAIEQITCSNHDLKNARSAYLTHFARNTRVSGGNVRVPLRGGALRAPGHNVTTFMVDVFIDAMAEAAKIDSLVYRLGLHGDDWALKKLGWESAPTKNLGMVHLFKKAAVLSGWGSDPNFAYGIGSLQSYGSGIVVVAKAPREPKGNLIDSLYAVVNCGQVVNRSGVEAQVEGGLVDSLSAALLQKITLEKGEVQESNFHDYQLLRMNQSVKTVIEIIDTDAAPGGMGEVAYPAGIPAICNALSAAQGRRISELPYNEIYA